MGRSFPWASSFDSDFNYDFQAPITKEQWESGAVEYNFRGVDFRLPEGADANPFIADHVERWNGLADVQARSPGVSAFALEDGVVYHT